ncbi:MAG: ribose 5-phosphate isomerase B [Candidatus Kapaibacterium sp.]
MRIGIGSDHAGYRYKSMIAEMLREAGHDVHDFGTQSEERTDYPDYAFATAEAVSQGRCEAGVLVCGSGIGVAITANKVDGIRAATCTSAEMARLSRQHNDANIVCLGERLVTPDQAREIVNEFLRTGFEGGRHEERVAKIHQLTGR